MGSGAGDDFDEGLGVRAVGGVDEIGCCGGEEEREQKQSCEELQS